MIFKHRKRGTFYRFLTLSVREDDLETLVNYSCLTTGQVWTRPASEFFDGRFEAAPMVADPRGSGETVH